jgi:hypothetical protein
VDTQTERRKNEYRRGDVKAEMLLHNKSKPKTSGDVIGHLPFDRELFLIASIAESMSASLINVHPEGGSRQVGFTFTRFVTRGAQMFLDA